MTSTQSGHAQRSAGRDWRHGLRLAAHPVVAVLFASGTVYMAATKGWAALILLPVALAWAVFLAAMTWQTGKLAHLLRQRSLPAGQLSIQRLRWLRPATVVSFDSGISLLPGTARAGRVSIAGLLHIPAASWLVDFFQAMTGLFLLVTFIGAVFWAVLLLRASRGRTPIAV